MANWTGLWDEAEDKLAEILGEHLDGIPKVDELPDVMPERDVCMYVVNLHGGGTAIEPQSENYSIRGGLEGSAREKRIDATITAIATTKVLARRFAESIWNALPVEPDARPIFRVWVSSEPLIVRGTYGRQINAGVDRQVWKVECILAVELYKGGN